MSHGAFVPVPRSQPAVGFHFGPLHLPEGFGFGGVEEIEEPLDFTRAGVVEDFIHDNLGLFGGHNPNPICRGSPGAGLHAFPSLNQSIHTPNASPVLSTPLDFTP